MRKTNNSHRMSTVSQLFNEVTKLSLRNEKPKKYPSPITFRPTDEEREMLKLDAAGMSQCPTRN